MAQLLFYSRHTLTEAMESLYPGFDNLSALYNEYAFRALDESALNYVNYLRETLKINRYCFSIKHCVLWRNK